MLASSDSAGWKAAIDLYFQDRLDDSYDLVRRHGLGEGGMYMSWNRMIEAEWMTRQKSRVDEINHWLEIEYITSEIGDEIESLKLIAQEAVDDAASRLDWQHGPKVRIAVMTEAAHAPWAISPHGYCQDKYPYGKIVIPRYAAANPRYFHQVVAHEYAHVITTHLTQNRAPRWLHEALSVLVERAPDRRLTKELKAGYAKWLKSGELEAALEGHAFDPSGRDLRALAYEQSGWVGRYLATMAEESRLGDLLRAHVNVPAWKSLPQFLIGRTYTDIAMVATYGFDCDELFERTERFVKGLTV